MKLLIAMMTMALLTACNDGTKPKKLFNEMKTTSITYAHNWNQNDYRTVTAVRIIKDTLMRDTVDVTKNVMKRDTFYFPYETLILLDSVTKKPMIDSTGNYKKTFRPFLINKNQVIEDFLKDWKTDTLKNTK